MPSSRAPRESLLPIGLDGIAFGGDYNPEQWPRAVWDEDVLLMREAEVNLVTVGVFSWAQLEPSEGRFEFDWLDHVISLLHANGIAVDLATATASPPPWLSYTYPETLPQTHDGRQIWYGSRQSFCPSSRVFREKAIALVDALAARYADHPAVALWHVSNELGCHNALCYCDVSAAAFREWLQRRYGHLEALNDAWATTVWSQRYGEWAQILPPRLTSASHNPAQQLDFRRFSSDALLELYRAERSAIRRHDPDAAITTNLMAADYFRDANYHTWAAELDLVSNDHYVDVADSQSHFDLAFWADVTRGLADGGPWLLMEKAVSAVSWRDRNLPKAPGQLLRNSIQHIARGADGVCFFQWRAAPAGAEMFHSGLVPHAGTESRVWREVTQLGASLARLKEVAGTTVASTVALLFDWEAWWACDLGSRPSIDLRYIEEVKHFYAALWRAGMTVDVAHPDTDLSRYAMMVMPTLYLVSDDAAARIGRYVADGGTLLVTYFSGIVDENDHMRLGGYPGAFREVLGAVAEEFVPLVEGRTVTLDTGMVSGIWSEDLQAQEAEVVATYLDGPLPGVPAITRNHFGGGTAWYVATQLEDESLDQLILEVGQQAGIPAARPPEGVELVRRESRDRSYLFALNHGASRAVLAVTGRELLSDKACEGEYVLEPGAVAVLAEEPPRASLTATEQRGTDRSSGESFTHG